MTKIYALWVIIAETVGGIAGFLTRNDTKIYADTITKPLLSPPPLVFPVVWVVLYALMGISAARVFAAEKSQYRTRGLWLFVAQLAVNFSWCFVFFKFRAFGWAFVVLSVLLVLVLMMCMNFLRAERFSAYLQVPYVLWLVFAGYLNAGVYFLNA